MAALSGGTVRRPVTLSLLGPSHLVGLEVAWEIDVPVRGEHRERVPYDPDRHAVFVRQIGGWQDVPGLVLAGLDLAAKYAREFDVLRRVVGIDVVEHRQVGDVSHDRSCHPGERRENRFSALLLLPAPMSRQRLYDLQPPSLQAVG